MWRFPLAALAMVVALVVLFAGAVGREETMQTIQAALATVFPQRTVDNSIQSTRSDIRPAPVSTKPQSMQDDSMQSVLSRLRSEQPVSPPVAPKGQ